MKQPVVYATELCGRAKKRKILQNATDTKKIINGIVRDASFSNEEGPYKFYKIKLRYRKDKLRFRVKFAKNRDAVACYNLIRSDPTLVYLKTKFKLRTPKIRKTPKPKYVMPNKINLPFLHVKLTSVNQCFWGNKKELKQKIVDSVNKTAINFPNGRYHYYKVEVKRTEKIVI